MRDKRALPRTSQTHDSNEDIAVAGFLAPSEQRCVDMNGWKGWSDNIHLDWLLVLTGDARFEERSEDEDCKQIYKHVAMRMMMVTE